ncbi:protein RER1 isoform X2 [Trichogramma pretiosum]|uniref:protein RER1 isoform X2 n=1 Tax=Trichogramma pretiosum TaxID=7493 RepID=UPI0006C9D08D|nr:protein RER1 isoform X2 [Trichogramma pretiosum]
MPNSRSIFTSFRKEGKMMQDEDIQSSSKGNICTQAWTRLSQTYQGWLDSWTPHTTSRWVVAFFLVITFVLRIVLSQGWYVIAYALGIYHLNLFVSFLTPKNDPAMGIEDNDGPSLPTRSNEEFRPFIRRLPEFKFWYSVCKSTLIGLICTLFECFNVPVFWPILVMYFITLTCITMRRQIKHMIKYRYIPFTYGKPKYQNHLDGK